MSSSLVSAQPSKFYSTLIPASATHVATPLAMDLEIGQLLYRHHHTTNDTDYYQSCDKPILEVHNAIPNLLLTLPILPSYSTFYHHTPPTQWRNISSPGSSFKTKTQISLLGTQFILNGHRYRIEIKFSLKFDN